MLNHYQRQVFYAEERRRNRLGILIADMRDAVSANDLRVKPMVSMIARLREKRGIRLRLVGK